MPKYVFAYHGGSMPETEEEQAEVMATWGAWFESMGAAVVDAGNPIHETRTVASDGSSSDGGGANPLNGYSLLTADSIDAAVKLAGGCPVLGAGGSVEVAETMEM